MSAKKTIQKAEPKTIELKTPEFSINFQEKHHISMLGWHQNFTEFNKGKLKGHVILVGSQIGISIENLYSFTFPIEQLITFCLRELAKYKRGKK